MCCAPAQRQVPSASSLPLVMAPSQTASEMAEEGGSDGTMQAAQVLYSLRDKQKQGVPDPSLSLSSAHGGSPVSLTETQMPHFSCSSIGQNSQLS